MFVDEKALSEHHQDFLKRHEAKFEVNCKLSCWVITHELKLELAIGPRY